MSGLEFPMKRVGLTLVLTSPAFEEDFLDIKEGVELTVSRPRRSRSVKQNGTFHAVLGDLIKGGVWTGSMESFKQMIKLRINWGDWYPVSDGKALFVARPTPQDQTEFNEFMERCKDALVTHFNVESDALEALFKKWSKEGKAERDAKKQKAESPEESEITMADLATRLIQLAVQLDFDTTAALDAKWTKLKAVDETKALHKAAPKAVEDIVTAARAYARGRYGRREFNDAVDAAISTLTT